MRQTVRRSPHRRAMLDQQLDHRRRPVHRRIVQGAVFDIYVLEHARGCDVFQKDSGQSDVVLLQCVREKVCVTACLGYNPWAEVREQDGNDVELAAVAGGSQGVVAELVIAIGLVLALGLGVPGGFVCEG